VIAQAHSSSESRLKSIAQRLARSEVSVCEEPEHAVIRATGSSGGTEGEAGQNKSQDLCQLFR